MTGVRQAHHVLRRLQSRDSVSRSAQVRELEAEPETSDDDDDDALDDAQLLRDLELVEQRCAQAKPEVGQPEVKPEAEAMDDAVDDEQLLKDLEFIEQCGAWS